MTSGPGLGRKERLSYMLVEVAYLFPWLRVGSRPQRPLRSKERSLHEAVMTLQRGKLPLFSPPVIRVQEIDAQKAGSGKKTC